MAAEPAAAPSTVELAELVGVLREAARRHQAHWMGPALAFWLGVLACVAVGVAVAVSLRRSAALRAHLGRVVHSVKGGLPTETLSSLFGGDLPSWLADPDVSRMDWANTALEGLWPQIDAAATKCARGTRFLRVRLRVPARACGCSVGETRWRGGECPTERIGAKEPGATMQPGGGFLSRPGACVS